MWTIQLLKQNSTGQGANVEMRGIICSQVMRPQHQQLRLMMMGRRCWPGACCKLPGRCGVWLPRAHGSQPVNRLDFWPSAPIKGRDIESRLATVWCSGPGLERDVLVVVFPVDGKEDDRYIHDVLDYANTDRHQHSTTRHGLMRRWQLHSNTLLI